MNLDCRRQTYSGQGDASEILTDKKVKAPDYSTSKRDFANCLK